MVNQIKLLFSILSSLNSIKKSYKDNFKTVTVPRAVHFEATYACTCKCVFCSRWKLGDKKIGEELSYDQIIDLINQAYELGVRLFTLSGGEPLLKKGILDAMKYARKKGMITNVTTNGTLINEENVNRVLSAFDSINISLDSWDEKKHDKIRGINGTYKKALNTIKLLKKYSKNTHINVQSTLTAENFDDLAKINKELSGLGISTFFQPIHDNPNNNFNIADRKFSDFDLNQLKGKWKDFIDGYKYNNSFEKLFFKEFHEKSQDFIEFPSSTINFFHCFAGSLSFFVDPYGEVFPCESLRVKMGNIKDKKLKEIWYDEKNNKLRRRIKSRECNCWLLCSAPLFMTVSKVIKNNPSSFYQTGKYIFSMFSWAKSK